MALSPKEKKELQQRFEKQLLPDLDMSFELNGEVYKFNFDKNESGDYIKCKSMIFHKEKNIYVCLSCHKQTEPFLPIDWNSNDYDWLPYEDEY